MRRLWVGRKDFHNFHWTKKNKFKEGHEKAWEKKVIGSCVFRGVRTGGKFVGRELVVICEEMLSMEEKCVKTK
jgi:hypothetical protein